MCLSKPVMCAAASQLCVSAIKRRHVAVLHVHPVRHSLAVSSRCVAVAVAVVTVVVVVVVVVGVPSACLHVHGIAVVVS